MPERMKAYRITTQGGPGQWDEVPVPSAGPGEVILRTSASGLCRTDLEMMDHGAQFLPWIGPFTIGHESAGHVLEIGDGVVGLAVGDAVLVHSNTSCGHCANCLRGRDQFCLDKPPNYGVGADGGLAPYMKARQRDLVEIGALDPRVAAPLADAGATGYGAVLDVRRYVLDDGYVAVIGVGGIGGVAVQLLRRLTGARVIAVERPERFGFARDNGADELVASAPAAAEEIMALTGGRGVDATIDVVGADDTLALAAAITASLGAISLVGLSGGTFPFGFAAPRPGVRVFTSTTCSLGELRRVVDFAQRGDLVIRHETFAFDDIERGYDALRAGQVDGRAVIDFAAA